MNLLTRFLFSWSIILFLIQTALAASARLELPQQFQTDFPEVAWEASEFTVEEVTKGTSTVRYVKIQGWVTDEDLSIVMGSEAIEGEQSATAIQMEEITPLQKDQKVYRQRFSGKIEISGDHTPVELMLVLPSGDLKKLNINLIIDKPRPTPWAGELGVLLPFTYNNTFTATQGRISSAVLGMGPTFKAGMSYFKPGQDSRGLEYGATSRISYISPLQGVSYPILGSISGKLGFRNWKKPGGRETNELSPFASITYEKYAMISSYSTPPSVNYEIRSFGFAWLGLGMKAVLGNTRLWTLMGELAYSAIGTSSYSSSGMNSGCSALKFTVLGSTPIWKNFVGQAEITSMAIFNNEYAYLLSGSLGIGYLF